MSSYGQTNEDRRLGREANAARQRAVTAQQPHRFRLATGRTALNHSAPLPAFPVAAGPRPTGGAAADPDHPSRKHDIGARATRVRLAANDAPAWAKILHRYPLDPFTRRRVRRALARRLAIVDRAASSWREDGKLQ